MRTHTNPDKAAHAALVTVVGLHLQQVRAARLSVQSPLSSSDQTRHKVYTELTSTVTYNTTHTHTQTLLYIVKSKRLNPLQRIIGIFCPYTVCQICLPHNFRGIFKRWWMILHTAVTLTRLTVKNCKWNYYNAHLKYNNYKTGKTQELAKIK